MACDAIHLMKGWGKYRWDVAGRNSAAASPAFRYAQAFECGAGPSVSGRSSPSRQNQACKAGLLAAHVPCAEIALNAQNPTCQLPVGTDLATAERAGGDAVVAETRDVDGAIRALS
jgi:hypothetical protein